jgi:hypothetical protein
MGIVEFDQGINIRWKNRYHESHDILISTIYSSFPKIADIIVMICLDVSRNGLALRVTIL